MKIGVISDTHDFLDPRIPDLFADVDHIIHGGDIGLPALLLELELIAPVTAVGGNTDDPTFRYRDTKVVEQAAQKFLVHHIVEPRSLGDDLKLKIQREKPNVVVFGHTHKPFNEVIGGILFFNPGYAGKNKFGLQRSIAILHCEGKEIRPQFISL